MKFKGYTLIELVVVAGILGVIGVVSVGLFLSTLSGGGKSSALNEVRSNGDYAIIQMERMIRNARYVVVDDLDSDLSCEADMSTITIKNPDGGTTTFSADQGRIASNSGYMTSSDILLVDLGVDKYLDFDCVSGDSKAPEVVTISFTLQKGDEDQPNRNYAKADFSTTVQLRSF